MEASSFISAVLAAVALSPGRAVAQTVGAARYFVPTVWLGNAAPAAGLQTEVAVSLLRPVASTPALLLPTPAVVEAAADAPEARTSRARTSAVDVLERGARELAAVKTSAGDSRRAALEGMFEGAAVRDPVQLGRRKISESYRFPAAGAVKVAFFDADSTLRVSLSGNVSANGPRDVLLLPGVSAKLGALAREGYLIVIVSNQGGVARYVSLEDADAALAYTGELIRSEGGELHYYDFAENRDGDRKPGIGMALRLESLLKDTFGPGAHIDKSRSLMVGDSAYTPEDTRPDGNPGAHFRNSDRLFAQAYGISFQEPSDFFGWRPYGVDVFHDASEVEFFLKAHPSNAQSPLAGPLARRTFPAFSTKRR